MRFLLDPVNTSGGGLATKAAVDQGTLQALLDQLAVGKSSTVEVAATPAKPPETVAKPETDPVINEVRDFLAKLSNDAVENDRRQKEALAAIEKETLLANLNQIATKGNLTEMREALGKLDGFVNQKLSEKDQQLQQARDLYHSSLLKSEVSRVLAGVPFASQAAARDAQDKILARLEVIDEGNGPVIREKKTGKPAETVIKESLSTEDFLHFLSPAGKGKGGIGGGSQSQPTGGVNAAPASYGDWVKQQLELQKQQTTAAGLVVTPGLTLRR